MKFSPAVIDAAAEAEDEWLSRPGSRLETGHTLKEWEAFRLRAVLTAAFAVMAPCPTCGGTDDVVMLASQRALTAGVHPCPDHREPVPQLLLDLGPEMLWAALKATGAVEEVGIRDMKKSALTQHYVGGGPSWTYLDGASRAYNPDLIIEPLFRYVGRSVPE